MKAKELARLFAEEMVRQYERNSNAPPVDGDAGLREFVVEPGEIDLVALARVAKKALKEEAGAGSGAEKPFPELMPGETLSFTHHRETPTNRPYVSASFTIDGAMNKFVQAKDMATAFPAAIEAVGIYRANAPAPTDDAEPAIKTEAFQCPYCDFMHASLSILGQHYRDKHGIRLGGDGPRVKPAPIHFLDGTKKT